jgi:hypothetical protein
MGISDLISREICNPPLVVFRQYLQLCYNLYPLAESIFTGGFYDWLVNNAFENTPDGKGRYEITADFCSDRGVRSACRRLDLLR